MDVHWMVRVVQGRVCGHWVPLGVEGVGGGAGGLGVACPGVGNGVGWFWCSLGVGWVGCGGGLWRPVLVVGF